MSPNKPNRGADFLRFPPSGRRKLDASHEANPIIQADSFRVLNVMTNAGERIALGVMFHLEPDEVIEVLFIAGDVAQLDGIIGDLIDARESLYGEKGDA
jgi:hypothetical protein